MPDALVREIGRETLAGGRLRIAIGAEYWYSFGVDSVAKKTD